jgi:hypothetical protein
MEQAKNGTEFVNSSEAMTRIEIAQKTDLHSTGT